jgi:putative restriction endonuclease
VRAFVGVTDQDWYQFLLARPHLSEVNFWRPSGRGFQAIGSGEPFVFKTHKPNDHLVGGGFLSNATTLRISEAWEFFGEANGVPSLEAMRLAIARYRRQPLGDDEDPMVGCVLLRDVFFVDESEAISPPPDFAANIVMGKSYDLESESGSYLEAALETLLRASTEAAVVPGAVFGDPRLVAARLGQRAFKALVLTAYERRCAITGAKIRPVLEAAHIRPVSQEGQNRVDNGLLLRSDIHTLFDRGYLGVDPALRLHVSPRLRRDFGNGDEFYSRAGESLVSLPSRRVDRPDRDALEWHMDTLFMSA